MLLGERQNALFVGKQGSFVMLSQKLLHVRWLFTVSTVCYRNYTLI